MPKNTQKDNTTLGLKVALRRNLLAELPGPVFVVETHGGVGHVWERCYRDLDGTVFEKDAGKAAVLAKQRPTWAVYEGDCVPALRAGVGFHRTPGLLDVDPYGEPWPVFDAFFAGGRDWPPVLGVAVNDGMIQKIKLGGGWDVASLADIVARIGATAVKADYLGACRLLLEEKAGQVGYTLARWAGYYCGTNGQMTHYGAVLRRAG